MRTICIINIKQIPINSVRKKYRLLNNMVKYNTCLYDNFSSYYSCTYSYEILASRYPGVQITLEWAVRLDFRRVNGNSIKGLSC